MHEPPTRITGAERGRLGAEDQWRSFQTYLAAYLAGMLHPRDVFTVSRRDSAAPPLVEFRYLRDGALRLSLGELAWSDEPDAYVTVGTDDADRVAAQTVQRLRGVDGVDEPRDLRLSGSGPASSVAVLATGGFMNFGGTGTVHPARRAAQAARMVARVDTDGDAIEAAAREAGSRAFAGTRSATIAAVAAARALAGLRTWTDPFSPTPDSGYLVGGQPQDREQAPEPGAGR